MALDDIYLVTNEFEYQGNPNTYSWYLKVVLEGNPDGIPADALAFGVARETAWLALHNPSVNFNCVTARQVYPDTSLPQLEITGNSGNRSCTPVLGHLPGQCSCVVTQYGDITNPDKNNRGRDFITGQCCDDQIDGEYDSGIGSYLESLCAMYATMTNHYVNGANEFDIGVYSPSRAKPPGWPGNPSLPPFFWTLQHVRGRSLVRTQRRRQPLDPCEAVCDQAIGPLPPP